MKICIEARSARVPGAPERFGAVEKLRLRKGIGGFAVGRIPAWLAMWRAHVSVFVFVCLFLSCVRACARACVRAGVPGWVGVCV